MRKAFRHILIPIALIMLIAACGGGDTSQTTVAPGSDATTTIAAAGSTSGAEVLLKQFNFMPDDIAITVGDTVTWNNTDRILHTVSAGTPDSPGGLFDTDLDDAGSTTEFTFTEAGDYEYFCSIHPHMQGVVRVTDNG